MFPGGKIEPLMFFFPKCLCGKVLSGTPTPLLHYSLPFRLEFSTASFIIGIKDTRGKCMQSTGFTKTKENIEFY